MNEICQTALERRWRRFFWCVSNILFQMYKQGSCQCVRNFASFGHALSDGSRKPIHSVDATDRFRSESVLVWRHSGVVAPGLRRAKKMRAPVRRRQALRTVAWNARRRGRLWCRHHLKDAQDHTCRWCFGSVKPSEPAAEGVALIPSVLAASVEPYQYRRDVTTTCDQDLERPFWFDCLAGKTIPQPCVEAGETQCIGMSSAPTKSAPRVEHLAKVT